MANGYNLPGVAAGRLTEKTPKRVFGPEEVLAVASPFETGPMAIPGSMLQNLIPTSLNLRNLQLGQLLGEIHRPSFASLLSAPGVEQATQQYRSNIQTGMGNLARGGLVNTGFREALRRGAMESLGGGLMQAYTRGEAGESARRKDLLGQLFNLISGDIGFLQALHTGPYAGNRQAGIDALTRGINTSLGILSAAGLGGKETAVQMPIPPTGAVTDVYGTAIRYPGGANRRPMDYGFTLYP